MYGCPVRRRILWQDTRPLNVWMRCTPQDLMTRHTTAQCMEALRADSRFAPSQWKTALLCNDVSHWLSTSLESALALSATGSCDKTPDRSINEGPSHRRIWWQDNQTPQWIEALHAAGSDDKTHDHSMYGGPVSHRILWWDTRSLNVWIPFTPQNLMTR